MARSPDPSKSTKPGSAREDRLKAALKANMARRKAQARARAEKQAQKAEGSQGAGAEKDA
ncbi:hypothetical protein [Roseobacter sinensis]|uniref:Amidase n=1 Tax=Roseobacter sinensis TaxID=2931391 RepID=A0ABT3BL82_9RHOB|nr:hypothetical protein [Roseobacter sp. WL0113]MCV3274342.1 hypothetical protein [Roseobacter sp. WL0113]